MAGDLFKPTYKICISGAAETEHCAEGAREKAELVGREVAARGYVLVTGATTGIPYWAAKGAKEEGGMVIGFSPASSRIAHVKTYHLPLDYHDVIVYTGFEYGGRNLILTRSADAVVIVCGRIGTLNEYTSAFEDDKPIGVLLETGGTADMLKNILAGAHRGVGKTIFSSDPSKLLDELTALMKKQDEENHVRG